MKIKYTGKIAMYVQVMLNICFKQPYVQKLTTYDEHMITTNICLICVFNWSL